MFGLVKVAIGGLTSGVAGRWEGEAKFCELDKLIPVYIAHFQRLRAQLALDDGHPLLATAARMIAEAKEACADYRRRIEANRSSRVAEAVDTAKELAGGVVGIRYWETRFADLLSKMQSLVVASLTLTVESASALPRPDTNAPLFQYLAHCFSLVRLECEVPKPPRPADMYDGFPGFVWTGDDAPYSGRLDVRWERPAGPCVGFDGGCDLGADAARSLYRSRPRRYQLWCERSYDVVQGSLNQLRQLGVDDFLEPSAIGLGRHVMEVESEEELVVAQVVGQSEGLAAGTKYSMAVRSWLNPPPGCTTAWSKWSDWSLVGCTSPAHHVVTHLRCVAASEHGVVITWMRPKLAMYGTSSNAEQQAQQVRALRPESWELGELDSSGLEPEPEPEPESTAVEWEYEVRMERTGARQTVQTVQAKVAGTITHLFNRAGVWQHQEEQTGVEPGADVETEGLARPATTHHQGYARRQSDHIGKDDTGDVAAAGEMNHLRRGGVPDPSDEPRLVRGQVQSESEAGMWDAVGGDRTKQMEVQYRLEAAEHSKEKLEAALLEAATILPDEQAVIRATVLSNKLAVSFCAGEALGAPDSTGQDHEQQPRKDGCHGDSSTGSCSVLLRAGSRELEALEPGVTYRVSVRARPCMQLADAVPGSPAGTASHGPQEDEATESEWGGWCPVVLMQTLPAAWNPPPVIESPTEGWEVTVGEGCQITWSWPAATATVAPSAAHAGHARVAVKEILFTSQSGFHRHSTPVPVSAPLLGEEHKQPDAGLFSWDWDGRLWPSAMADMPDSRVYIDTPSPPSFIVFVYLKFVGADGHITYTAAHRLLMQYPPLLQINAPPTGQWVPDYTVVASDYQDELGGDGSRVIGTRDDAVASVTAGDPVDIRWEMMEGVTVSHITLTQRAGSWLSSLSTLSSATPVITLATASSVSSGGADGVCEPRPRSESLTPTSTSYHWNGRLPVTIVDSGLVTGAQKDLEGALPTGGKYVVVVHCVAPPEIGGAKHGVQVPIDLDEPFEMVGIPRLPGPAILSEQRPPAVTAAAGGAMRIDRPAGEWTDGDRDSESGDEHVHVQLPLSPGSRPLHI